MNAGDLSGRSVLPHSRSRLKWSIRPRWKWTGFFQKIRDPPRIFLTIRVGERSNTFFYSREGKDIREGRIMTTATGSTGKETGGTSLWADYMDLRRARAGRRKVWESA